MEGNNGVPHTFPFATVRSGQKEFLADAMSSVSNGKHLVAQAPTGLGKTAVGLAAAIDCAMHGEKLVLFLTSRQSQHRIVVDTLQRIRGRAVDVRAVDIIGKLSMCPQPHRPSNSRAFQEFCSLMTKTRACKFFTRQADATAREILERPIHVQEMQRLCTSKGVCPHKTALEAASRAHVLVCDYNYVFSSIGDMMLSRLNRQTSELILVVDEAHNLPERIRSQLKGGISPRQLLRGARQAKEVDRELAQELTLFGKTIDCFLGGFKGERKVGTSLLGEIVEGTHPGGPWNLETLARSCRSAGETLARNGVDTALLDISAFLEGWRQSGPWIVRVASGSDDRSLGYRLLDPSMLCKDVFKEVHSSILMSGTLHPGSMYADLLGLEKERILLRSYPSPFPRENRLTLVSNKLTTLFRARSGAMYDAMAREIANIIGVVPGNIAAFFPSYDLMGRIACKIKTRPLRKYLLMESHEWDKSTRDKAVSRLIEMKARGGAVLLGVLGGSFSEGIDFKDNLLSCVVVCGLPISPPTVETKALNEYYAEKFDRDKGYQYAYLYPAMNKVLQAAGRCIRSESDRAAVAILDNRLLTSRYSSCLPDEFDMRAVGDIAENVGTFFYGRGIRKSRDSQTGRRGRAEAGELARTAGRGEAPCAEGLPQPAD